MQEVNELAAFYDFINKYRQEFVITCMILVNPLISYILTRQTKVLSWKSGYHPSNIVVRIYAFMISLSINVVVGLRWGDIEWEDVAIISILVASLTPWIVSRILASTRNPTGRLHWVYVWVHGDRRKHMKHQKPYVGEDRRGTGDGFEPTDTMTTLGIRDLDDTLDGDDSGTK